jgi:hypothetical protein
MKKNMVEVAWKSVAAAEPNDQKVRTTEDCAAILASSAALQRFLSTASVCSK